MSKQASKTVKKVIGVVRDLMADLVKSLTRYGEKSIEANDIIYKAEQSKAELKECARVALESVFGANWHEIPTFNPKLDHNKAKDPAHIQLNNARIALQENQKAALIAKYGSDDKGYPLQGNPDSAWQEIKALQKMILSQPDKTTKTDKKRAVGRDANQVFADSVLAFTDYVTRQVKKGLNGFEADSAPLLRDLNKLIVKHGIKTGTTRK